MNGLQLVCEYSLDHLTHVIFTRIFTENLVIPDPKHLRGPAPRPQSNTKLDECSLERSSHKEDFSELPKNTVRDCHAGKLSPALCMCHISTCA